MRPISLRRRSACILPALLLACGGSGPSETMPPPPPPTPTVASVAILSAPSGPIQVGDAVQLQAEARDNGGSLLTGQAFVWSSDKPTVVTVTRSGRVVAMAEGTATITVSVAGRSASASITVAPSQVTSIGVQPATLALAPGATARFNANAIGDNGVIPGITIQWNSSDQSVATVDATGLVTAVGQGTARITARVGAVERSRGVTVSTETWNLRIFRADFIQVAQNATADVPLVRGKPTAIRLFPVADNVAGLEDVPIQVTLRKAGAVIFDTRINSGVVFPVPSITDGMQGVMVPLPPALDIEGATLQVTIDPDNTIAEFDEWDNSTPIPGDDPPTVAMVSVPTLHIRLVPVAPQGGTLPSVTSTTIASISELMRTIYPTASVDVTVRSGGIITTYPWPDRTALIDVLGELDVERTADGYTGSYYGVQQVGAIGGIVGIAWLGGRSALGTAQGEVFAHEIGHNLGLAHPPGCGADNANTGYPYPDGQIGLRGFDPRSGQAVPPWAIDMMGYCPGFKWISGGHYRGIMSALQSQGLSTLRVTPGDAVPFAITAHGDDGDLSAGRARRLAHAQSVSEDVGEVTVEALDAGSVVLATHHLPLRAVADLPARRVAGVVPVPAAAAGRVVALRLRLGGSELVVPVGN